MPGYESPSLNIPYIQQPDGFTCGPTCVQMVLKSLWLKQASPAPSTLNDLYNLITYTEQDVHRTEDTGVNWTTAPDQIAGVLNSSYAPTAYRGDFSMAIEGDVKAISDDIVRAIYKDKVAPIALVWGIKHWIVVTSFVTDIEPVDGSDFNVQRFIVNDPALPGDHVIEYPTWEGHDRHNRRDARMRGVPSGRPSGSSNRSKWHGKFIAVCDPKGGDEEDEFVLERDQSSKPTRTHRQAPGANENADDLEIYSRLTLPEAIDEAKQANNDRARNKARESAKEQIEERLFSLDKWKIFRDHLQPGEPVLVKRLDLPSDYFFLVPMRTKGGKCPVIAKVDALTGEYEEALVITVRFQGEAPEEDPSSSLDKRIEKDVLRNMNYTPDRFLDKAIQRPGNLEPFKTSSANRFPTLVWKPCIESFSPFTPFHLFARGDDHILLRIDDEVIEDGIVTNNLREVRAPREDSPTHVIRTRAEEPVKLALNKVIMHLNDSELGT